MRRVQHGDLDAMREPPQDAGRAAEQVWVAVKLRRDRDPRHHRRITGQERHHLDAMGLQRCGERAGDIGEPTGFHQRKEF